MRFGVVGIQPRGALGACSIDGGYQLLDRREAYRLIHRPADMRQAMRARRRIVFDELMLMQLALGLSKRMRDGRITAPILRADKTLDERIRKRFPFEMTNAQKAAVYEILRDVPVPIADRR